MEAGIVGEATVGDTVAMEPAAHRLDREAMLAEHIAVAARLDREVDEMVEAARRKRRVATDLLIARLRIDLGTQLAQAARAARHVAAEGEVTPPPPIESERLALAAAEERRKQLERYAEELLAETARVEARMRERRAEAEREADEILERAQAEARRAAAEMQERRAQVEREAYEIRARAREADHIVAVSRQQRDRVQELLTGMIASLDDGGASSEESVGGEAAPRTHERHESSVV